MQQNYIEYCKDGMATCALHPEKTIGGEVGGGGENVEPRVASIIYTVVKIPIVTPFAYVRN